MNEPSPSEARLIGAQEFSARLAAVGLSMAAVAKAAGYHVTALEDFLRSRKETRLSTRRAFEAVLLKHEASVLAHLLALHPAPFHPPALPSSGGFTAPPAAGCAAPASAGGAAFSGVAA